MFLSFLFSSPFFFFISVHLFFLKLIIAVCNFMLCCCVTQNHSSITRIDRQVEAMNLKSCLISPVINFLLLMHFPVLLLYHIQFNFENLNLSAAKHDYNSESCFWWFVDVCFVCKFVYLLFFRAPNIKDAVITLLIFSFCIHDFVEMMIMSHIWFMIVLYVFSSFVHLLFSTLPFSLGTKLIITSWMPTDTFGWKKCMREQIMTVCSPC